MPDDAAPDTSLAVAGEVDAQGPATGILDALGRPLGPYAYLVALTACLFGLLSISRALLAGYYFDRISSVPGFGWMFFYGLRIDAIVVGAVLVLPTLALASGCNPTRLRGFSEPTSA